MTGIRADGSGVWKRHSSVWWVVPVWIGVFALEGCDGGDRGSGSSGNQQAVSVSTDIVCTAWPLFWISERLAGDQLKVDWLYPEGGFTDGKRRTFFPSDSALESLQRTSLVIDSGLGVPYVGWVELVSWPEGQLCRASQNFRLGDFIPVPEVQVTHSHGPEGEHTHDYLVPYGWHQPELAGKMVREIARRIAECWPSVAATVNERATLLEADLAVVAEEWKETGELFPAGLPVVLASPDLLFVARGLGKELPWRVWKRGESDVDWETRLRELDAVAEGAKWGVVLFPGQVPVEAASAAGSHASRRWVLVEIDMLDNPVGERGFVERLRGIGESVRAAVVGEGGGGF